MGSTLLMIKLDSMMRAAPVRAQYSLRKRGESQRRLGM